MLKQDELTDALHDALKAADPPCGRFCVASVSVDGEHYVAVHNGVGASTTNVQTVIASGVLALSKDGLSAKLRGWINSVHDARPLDLNATMAAGGPVAAAPYVVGERGPALVGWPWRWTDGSAP